MNKQKPGGIGWCDYTWGPVTGCWGSGGTAEKPNRCPYCYAEKVANRFYPVPGVGDMIAKNKDPFQPWFHPDRLNQPAKVKKPSRIFVCSMADLFGDWVPATWIMKVLEVVHQNPRHTFQFLTKNPKNLIDCNPWPANCWVGTTVTNQDDMNERVGYLLNADARVRFISHEPLVGRIKQSQAWWNKVSPLLHWAIIGAMTGPGAVRPEVDWVHDLGAQYKAAGIPIFIKDNVGWASKVQEWPT